MSSNWDNLCRPAGHNGKVYITCPRGHTWRAMWGGRGHNCGKGWWGGDLHVSEDMPTPVVAVTTASNEEGGDKGIVDKPVPTSWETAVQG